ncbi:MAG: hypothetical protein AAGK00_19890 [Pseudomonadota bacterium]
MQQAPSLPERGGKRISALILGLHMAMASIFGVAFVFSESLSFLNAGLLLSFAAAGLLAITERPVLPALGVIVFLLLLVHGSLAMMAGLNTLGSFMRVYASTLAMFAMFYFLIMSKLSLEDILRVYLKYATAVGVIGIVQLVSYFVGFSPGYDYSWLLITWDVIYGGLFGIRVNSILFEPAHVAFTCGLAIACAVFRLFGQLEYLLSKRQAGVILVFTIVSGSTVAYMLIAVAMAIIALQRRFVVFAPLIIIAGWAAWSNIDLLPDIAVRLRGISQLYLEGVTWEDANASSFSIYAHTIVAFENFGATFGFGSSLGSHGAAFEKFNNVVVGDHEISQLSTAANLANRLISEMGMFGLALMIWYGVMVVRCMIEPDDHWHWLRLALLVAIFAFLARNGTYAYFGLALYVLVLRRLTVAEPVPFGDQTVITGRDYRGLPAE